MNNSEMLAFFSLPGGAEWIIILLVALLIFGRRLPDVARSLGQSIVEFKKGIREVNSNIEDGSRFDSAARIERRPEDASLPGPREASAEKTESKL